MPHDQDESEQGFIAHVHQLWIQPAIERLRIEGRLPEDFKIRQCLIRLPAEAPPIVQFNNEVAWKVRVQTPESRPLTAGQAVYLHEVASIVAAHPPEVDGKRVAFVFLYWTGSGYKLLFDFSPNLPEFVEATLRDPAEWTYSGAVADHLQHILTEQAVFSYQSVQQNLTEIGLWLAPALLPYPLSEIAVLVGEGRNQDAIDLLLKHCDKNFLRSIVEAWREVPAFVVRRTLFSDALEAHDQGKYTLSIYCLLPQLEGVITEWTLNVLPEVELPRRQVSKAKKFKALVLQSPPPTYVYKTIVESAIDFITTGPVLETFRAWAVSINTAFPNRHAVLHGKYDAALFSQVNSVKIFLLLDTLNHMMKERDPLDSA